jgi:hypothetical protein
MVKDGEHAEISAVAASLLGSIANSVAAATRIAVTPDRAASSNVAVLP